MFGFEGSEFPTCEHAPSRPIVNNETKKNNRNVKKLLDFFLMRYGTYKKIKNENQEFRLSFQSEIESKLYENYIRNLSKISKEHYEIELHFIVNSCNRALSS